MIMNKRIININLVMFHSCEFSLTAFEFRIFRIQRILIKIIIFVFFATFNSDHVNVIFLNYGYN